MTKQKKVVFLFSFPPFLCKQVLSKQLLWVLDLAWGTWEGLFAEWTHPFPAAQSQIVFSLALNFSVAWTTTKAQPWLGQGCWGTRWEESKPGILEKNMSPPMTPDTRPCLRLCWSAGAGLDAVPCPLSCPLAHVAEFSRIRDSGSLWEGLAVPGSCPPTSLPWKCSPKDRQAATGDRVLSLFPAFLTSHPSPSQMLAVTSGEQVDSVSAPD